MSLTLYNTLTRQKEVFTPIDPELVRLYACGPTVYNYAHIGNGRMAVVFDILVRLLRQIYPRVIYVSNITDVDDKIMAAAHELGQPIIDITEKYTAIYNQDMEALGNLRPDIQPRATEHISEMVEIIARLIERDCAYVVNEPEGQSVLFHVPSYKDYGVLSGRSRDEQIAGARVEVAAYKRDPADFILWKPSTPDQPGWSSPWGRGRPGWHIECSAMSSRHLGLPFDIHGGGADLKFPHHENEIAQSCAAHDHGKDTPPREFARYWVHNGFVTVSGEKMSKSLGNVTLPHDLLAHGIKGEVIRWALLSAHYRAPLDWSEQKMHEAQKHLDALYATLHSLQEKSVAYVNGSVSSPILEALYDDLNTPLAMTHLIHLQKEVAQHPTSENAGALYAAARLMGFGQADPMSWQTAPTITVDENWIRGLLSERTRARAAKDFKTSDRIRDDLLAKGIIIKDTPDGPVWMPKG